jgi:ABC-type antimicrobial peptide transport system permease subunit
LAVFIACIGLLGLVAISVVQRTKEIGIRKVLGASSGHIVTVLARRYATLVILSNVIAWPLAYVALDRWLRDFAYRTTAGADIFLVSGLMALGVALATIGIHTWRAANRNPVEALRYE